MAGSRKLVWWLFVQQSTKQTNPDLLSKRAHAHPNSVFITVLCYLSEKAKLNNKSLIR